MSNLTGKTLDIKELNIKKLKELFPEIVTEGKIDFEELKQILGDYTDENKEKYSFTWNGKGESLRISQTPSTGTLRPCKEESKDWDTTENLYIEGDNLEVLKLLQKSYYGKVKMIYIDPPYNTGNDILYKNDFHDSIGYYKQYTGQIDSKGLNLSTNTEANGRYHTDWLNMMYPRIRLSRNLLHKTGIFVLAIDEYERSRLELLCNEVFGESNYVGCIVTKSNPQGRGKKNIDPIHEYHLIYAKDRENMKEILIDNEQFGDFGYLLRSGTNSRKYERPKRYYPLLEKKGIITTIEEEEYLKIYAKKFEFDEVFIKELTNKYIKLGYNVIFPIAQNGEEKVWQREYSRVRNEVHTYIYQNNQIKVPKSDKRTPQSLWIQEKYSNPAYGTNIIKSLFGENSPFDFPKSIYTLKEFVSISGYDSIILDFFSGSATTAHAVMQLNAEDGGSRKHILVQIPEVTDEKSEAYKVGYKNICEIGKERIRLAGEKIKEENPEAKDLDIGFKVYKLDSTNLEKWDPSNDLEGSLNRYIDNIKKDRNREDLLYEIMLKMGLELSYEINEHKIGKNTIYEIGMGALMICLDTEISTEVADEMVKLKKELEPEEWKVVFLDNGFNSDANKTNIKEILKSSGLNEDAFTTI